ncbi:CHAT domain-containing protein [Micromonospora echinaurantiaca]|uniref:CHAT domain-containing protein n=1 Tax=Micromonospora echinaurantiaca TaxID=47857 RepID=A0A1C5H8N9_9ACTN|nr:CHAT domain-containing protein [Micromonospora echinaurantiaca]SCG42396.1 CHAT domain-containing protein [Micromonospora echinaurantiaca]
MWRRDTDPLARLRRRLDAFGSTMDPRHVLDPRALREAEDVAELVSRGSRQGRLDERAAEAVFLLACLHWYRYQVLPAGQGQAERDYAVLLTELLLAAAPERVPPSLLEMLRVHGPRSAAARGGVPGQRSAPSEAGARTAPTAPSGSGGPGSAGRAGSSGEPGSSGEEAMALFLEAAQLMGGAERSGDYSTADRAVDLLRRAVAGTPAGDPARLHYLSALGKAHRDLFLHRGRSPEHLRRAVEAHRESLESTPAGDRERPVRLFHLGNVLGDRYELDGDRAALDESITLLGDAARAAGVDPRIRAMAQGNLGQRLRDRWRLRHDSADLDRAVDALTAAAGGMADPRVTVLLGSALADRFTRAQAAADRDAAIGAYRTALAAGGLDRALAGVARVGLAALLGARYGTDGDPADLDAAIDAHLAAVADAPDPDGLRHIAGKLLEQRYARDRRDADLRSAIHLLRLGVAGAPDDTERAVRLSDLAYALGRWHAALDGLDTLRAAENGLREAVRLLPAGHPERPDVLNNLGELWREIADRTGAADRLEPAAAVLREAVATARPDSPKLPAYLSNLGLVLQALFARTQDLATLTEAVEVLRRALASTPAEHPDRLLVLTNYGSALNRRVEATLARPEGVADAVGPDVETAVAALREATDLARQGAEAHEVGKALGTLALANLLRHQVTGDPAALDEAVDALAAARDVTEGSGPDRHRLLTSLGGALLWRSRLAGRSADLAAAVRAFREAPAGLPAGHADRATYLINLAVALDEAAARAGGGVPVLDDDAQPAEPDPATEPAASDVREWAGTSPDALRAEALAALREAAAVEAAPSLLRATAARRYAALAEHLGDLPAALAGYASAIELIDLVAWHGMDPDDQARLLAQFPGLAGAAAACALAVGRPDRAVELLEYGRGVLLTRVRDARASLDALRKRAPELADRFAEVQAELDGLTPSPAGARAALATGAAVAGSALDVGMAVAGSAIGVGMEPPAGNPERRHELAVRRRELLADIRRLPGFADFLRPPAFADLTRAAGRGPVVLVNVARRRCDALVVDGSGVRVVPLPQLTQADLVDRVVAFLTAIRAVTAPAGAAPAGSGAAGGGPAEALADQRRRLAARRTITGTLDWLWRVVARPVLDDLDPAATGGTDLPRLWWCPTGLLSLLPLHAASPATGDGALDRVVPSYTASLRELLRAGDGRAAGSVTVDAALFVGLPQTPGLADLPGVDREQEIVTRHLARVQPLTGPAATRQAVLAALAGRPVAHLSCHGAQDLAAPALGRLALADGPLHVRDLWQLRAAAPAGLAVLSACETVRGGAVLPDETISLGTAFQLAGFRHVIGSLWSISDAVTARLCDRLYAGLAAPGGPGRIDPERAAIALHAAVRETRHALREAPELWAAYAHVGP